MHFKLIVHNSITMSSLKDLTYTLVEFEPEPSVPEANAMSTAPRRQDSVLNTELQTLISTVKVMH
jgi:hypothetical protein